METVESAPRNQPGVSREPIAIVGIGCRFAGGVDSPQSFWKLIANGDDGIMEVPKDRWSLRKYYDPDPSKPGKMYTRKGGFLRNPIDRFDGRFFGITPREAESMDPQQRLLLEVAWEAFEDGGQPPEMFVGSETGVYIGAFTLDNKLTQMAISNQRAINSHTAISSTMTILSNRLSYFFDLRGPSISIDTACSSSLVALHYACQDIWRGQCEMALAGGVNVIFRPEYGIGMCKGKFLAPDGRSKSFDARANGYARGEGAGVILLKPVSVAQQNGDLIYGLICGTGVNQDGRTDGITVPNPNSQRTLIEKVIRESSLESKDIRYFEAHGTGTAVGDPIEAAAIGSVLKDDRDEPCPIGSVKANIGHTEAASGIAGVIKTALCLREKKVPPLANLQTANPNIPFDELRLRLPRALEEMTGEDGPAHACVNSFGYGGTNAHAILREPPSQNIRPSLLDSNQSDATAELRFALPLSAKSVAALDSLAESYTALIQDQSEDELANICSSAALRRSHHDYRYLVVGNTKDEILSELNDLSEKKNSTDEQNAGVVSPGRAVFVYTGMGPQWWRMGRELLEQSSVFADASNECDTIFRKIAGWSILDELRRDESESRITQTDIAQPANFLIQVALTKLWQSLGVEPGVVVGHSVGEVTSAYVSGVLTLEEAATVSYHRSRIQRKTSGHGSMLAAAIDQSRAEHICDENKLVDIAAINSPTSVTLAGDTAQLQTLSKDLEKEGIFQRMLDVEVPYHSHLMDPILPELLECLADIDPRLPSLPLYSTVTGNQIQERTYDAAYWVRNVRESVLFAKTLESLLLDGHQIFLEVGPHPVLSTSIREVATATRVDTRLVSSLRRKEPEWPYLSGALSQLYRAGCEIDWSRFQQPGRKLTTLPAYPWQRNDRWIEPASSHSDRCAEPENPLLGEFSNSSDPVWTAEISSGLVPFIEDHHVEGLKVVPGASYVEIGLALQREVMESNEDVSVAVLEGLQFEQAMIVDANEDRIVSSRYDAERREFRISSRSSNATGNWQTHAHGHIGDSIEAADSSIDRTEIEKNCTRAIDPATHFQNMQSRGLTYGPAFQGIVSLAVNPVMQEVLARVVPPENIEAELDCYQLHPALLDSCFQALLAAIETDDTYVPISIRQIRLYKSPPATGFWCHGEARAEGNTWIEGSLRLFDDNGDIVAEVRGVRAQRLTDKHAASLDHAESCVYAYEWAEYESSVVELALQNGCLVVADSMRQAEGLLDVLNSAGIQNCKCLTVGESMSSNESTHYCVSSGTRSDLENAFSELGIENFSTIFDLRGLSVSVADSVGLDATTDLLSLVQTMVSLENGPDRLVVLTRGGQVFEQDQMVNGLAQSSLIGLMRVAMNEYPDHRFRLIDLDPNVDEIDWNQILPELGNEAIDREEELAIRDGVHWVRRLYGKEMGVDSLNHKNGVLHDTTFDSPLTLESRVSEEKDRDSHQSTRYVLDTEHESAGGELEVSVAAISRQANSTIEMAGTVTRINEGGTASRKFKTGDRISFPWLDSPKTRVSNLVLDDSVVSPTQNIDIEDLVANINPFANAWYCLHHLHKVSAGQRVLIHSADSPLGRAAIRIARLSGAEVYASTNFDERRTELLAEGVYGVLPATTADLSEELREHTDGQGVSLVLLDGSVAASLPAEHILSSFGSFIILDSDDSRLPGKANGGNHKYMSVSSESLFRAKPAEWCQSRKTVCELFGLGVLKPFDFERSDPDDLYDAQTKTPGDTSSFPTVVCIDRNKRVQVESASSDDAQFDADSRHLITGGFGGFGLSVADWLVEKGVRHLVLASRRGASTPEADKVMTHFQEQGIAVQAEALDIADTEQVEQLIQRIHTVDKPLAGVWHTAAVFDDGPFSDMTGDRLNTVFGPKSQGAWNLHTKTLDIPVEHFVLFSSIASYIGSPGQASYVASNNYLDALARYRQSIGLAGTSVSWGALAEVGVVSRYQEIEQYLERVGSKRLNPEQAMHMLDKIALIRPANLAVADVDWQLWSQFHPAWARSNRFKHLIAVADDETNNGESEFMLSLHEKSDDEKHALMQQLVVDNVATVMKLSKDDIRPQESLVQMGMDSLMAMELQSRLEKTTAIKFSTLELMKGNSMDELAQTLMELAGSDEGSNTSVETITEVSLVNDPTTTPFIDQSPETMLEDVASLGDDAVDMLLERLDSSTGDHTISKGV